MISRFKNGVTSFIEGVRLLTKDKTMRALGFVPAIMSLTLFTVGLVVGISYVDDIMSWVIHSNMSDYNIYLKSIIYIISFLLLSFILYFATFIVVSILAVPVCTALSQRVLVQTGYLVPTERGLKENIFSFANMLRVSLLKLGVIVVISMMLFVASFIPVVSPVALYLSLMLLTFDCMDYAMEHDEQGFRQRFTFFVRHWLEFSGFAVCMAIVLAIPFIHFILLPAAVLGTSVLYSRIQIAKRLKQGKL